MKCVIAGSIIKVFGRAVHSLAKVGDELYVEPGPNGVSFRAVSTSKAAFGTYEFSSDFFSHYDGGVVAGQQSDSDNDLVKCKVGMKAMLNVFKNVQQLPRKLEKCKLTLDGEAANFVIQFICRYGVVKTFNLPLIECETLQAVYDKTTCVNYMLCEPQVLCDILNNFQADQDEVTLFVTKEKIIFKSYLDDALDPTQAVSTCVSMKAGEFEVYDIKDEGEVTFCLKELRALLGWSEPLTANVALHFSGPGSPIIFVSKDSDPYIEAVFVLATLTKLSDSQVSKQYLTSKVHSPKRQNVAVSGGTPTDLPIQKKRHGIPRECTPLSSTSSPVATSAGLVDANRMSTSSVSNTNAKLNLNHSQNITTESPSLHPRSISRANGNKSCVRLSPLSSKRKIDEEDIELGDNKNTSRLGTPTTFDQRQISAQESFDGDQEMETTIPGTPQPKLANLLFRRCFESTFDPRNIPGSDTVFAEDSDEDQK